MDFRSFGVVLYELFECGKEPYAGMNNFEVIEYVKSGKRLAKPAFCPESLYQLMLHCWDIEPAKRPTFPEIGTTIEKLLDQLIPSDEVPSYSQANTAGSTFSITSPSYSGKYNTATTYDEPSKH